MTELPDTAEFRRLLATDELPAVDVLDLIQALDAARAKEFHHRELIGHLKGRAEAAEARTAAALNALHGPATDAVRVAAALDALVEGTGR